MGILQTAERSSHLDPSENVIYQRHLIAYKESANLISGTVLEIGSGEGYGMIELAPKAEHYIAIDKYETLISDFEGTIQTVISHLGLDFEENCLTFFKNRKVSQAPSIDQVRQPIYLTSINRWTNYEQELGAIKFLQQ